MHIHRFNLQPNLLQQQTRRNILPHLLRYGRAFNLYGEVRLYYVEIPKSMYNNFILPIRLFMNFLVYKPQDDVVRIAGYLGFSIISHFFTFLITGRGCLSFLLQKNVIIAYTFLIMLFTWFISHRFLSKQPFDYERQKSRKLLVLGAIYSVEPFIFLALSLFIEIKYFR